MLLQPSDVVAVSDTILYVTYFQVYLFTLKYLRAFELTLSIVGNHAAGPGLRDAALPTSGWPSERLINLPKHRAQRWNHGFTEYRGGSRHARVPYRQVERYGVDASKLPVPPEFFQVQGEHLRGRLLQSGRPALLGSTAVRMRGRVRVIACGE